MNYTLFNLTLIFFNFYVILNIKPILKKGNFIMNLLDF